MHIWDSRTAAGRTGVCRASRGDRTRANDHQPRNVYRRHGAWRARRGIPADPVSGRLGAIFGRGGAASHCARPLQIWTLRPLTAGEDSTGARGRAVWLGRQGRGRPLHFHARIRENLEPDMARIGARWQYTGVALYGLIPSSRSLDAKNKLFRNSRF